MNSDDVGLSGLAVELSTVETERVAHILEDYLAELENGGRPDAEALIARYPEQAEVLRVSLEKLEMLHLAAASLRSPDLLDPVGDGDGFSGPGRLGDFNLLREVGRGGMGIVYEAEQVSLGRKVALKVLPFAAALDARQLQRFKNEAQAAAHLHHPHIVPVHAVGCERGVHYYAMQFIEGQSLAQVIADLRFKIADLKDKESQSESYESSPSEANPEICNAQSAICNTTVVALSAEQSNTSREFFLAVAKLGVQAALALEHAHQLGVVHRDIKPANVLIDAQAHLWITDFGLARSQAPVGLTHSGDLVGTLRYMSPEQALAQHALVGPRSDVYSLGATLYELLTLEPVYSGQDRQELLRQISFEEPLPAGHWNAALPVELETIVLKALAKEPDGRYASAQELADDLNRFLEHKPILARRPSWRDRLQKWGARHRQAVLAAVGCLVLATIGLATSTYLIWREKQEVQNQAALTRAHAERAEANFRRSQKGVMDLLYLLEEKRWGASSTHRELRKAALEKGLAFFQEFLNEKDAAPAVHFQAARACNLMADIYCEQNNFDKATAIQAQGLAILEQLSNDFPDDADYRERLAIARFSLGWKLNLAHRHAEAVDQFSRAEAYHREAVQAPASAHALFNYAEFLLRSPLPEFRNVRRAIELARQAVTLEPSNDACWSTLAWAQYRTGDWKACGAAFEQVVKLRPDSAVADRYGLAMAYWRLGDREKARACYAQAVREADKNGQAAGVAEPVRREAAALLGINRASINQ